MIAIHSSKGSFSDRWIAYCMENHVPFKLVNCYSNDILDQLKDCDGLMWHFYHAKSTDYLMAKQLMFALSETGKRTFPDFNTAWHFDDKIGQKFLLESINAPLVATYLFFSKEKAMEWTCQTTFPKVFKLRGGAGSVNVKLVKNQEQARKLIRIAFGKGFKHNSLVPFHEVWVRFMQKKVSFFSLIKSFAHKFTKTHFADVYGKEKGYIYFQEFIPGNDHDIRIVVIGDKAFAIKRMVRENDFRASGSGNILYDKELFCENNIRLAFKIHEKLKSQCSAIDFIFDKGEPKIVETSFGFSPKGYDSCPGYWDRNLNWHEGKFDPYGWMVENLLRDGNE